MNPIAWFKQHTLIWVHRGIACSVVKLTAVSVKSIQSSTLLALSDNRQSTTFKFEELKFRSAVCKKHSIGITSTTSSTLEPHLLYLTAVELAPSLGTPWKHSAHTHTILLRNQQVDSIICKCGTKLAVLKNVSLTITHKNRMHQLLGVLPSQLIIITQHKQVSYCTSAYLLYLL